MALERIILNIIPAGDMPVFHCSQYENGRPVIIDLVSSDDDAFLVGEGVSVELHCRKCDDTIITMEPDEVDNNTVTFVTSEQLTACPGDNLCELVLYSDTDPVQTLATLNFILHVEPDPLAGGLTSESEISNLTQQIEDIAQEVIGNDYYNKTEVDTLLSGKADSNSVYTKAETDTLLSAKANTADLATVATTGDYDDLLNKPVIPVQVQSDYAQEDSTQVDYIKNKPDIAAMIAAALLEVMPVGTETGTPATFDTEIAAPLVSVSCDIVATGGNGTPDNPNPISGYTEANITANGNTYTIAFGQTVYGGVLDVTRGKLTVTHQILEKSVASMNNAEDFPGWRASGVRALVGAGLNTTFFNQIVNIGSEYSVNTNGINDELYLRKSTYGLTESQWKTQYPDLTIQFYVELATPFDIDLTPEVISAVVGTNNVYADTNGGTTVQFKDSIQHYIDTRV